MLARGALVGPDDLRLPRRREPAAPTPSTCAGLTMKDAERLLAERTLAALDGNVSETARTLGVSRRWLQYRLREWRDEPAAGVMPAAPLPFLDGIRPFAELARGPVASVFKAYDAAAGEVVLLKALRPSARRTPSSGARFAAEARLAATVDHPNVVRVRRVAADGAALVADWVEGQDLARLLAEAGRAPGRARGLRRRARRRAGSPPSTPPASSTATSSRPTCSSATTARSG